MGIFDFLRKIFELKKPPLVKVSYSITSNQRSINSTGEILDLRKEECPYCNGALQKIPQKKTKCPHCGEFILVRTRPKDNARVVVTKDEADKIDEEWSIIGGWHSEFLSRRQEIEKERQRLRERFGGKEPTDSDIQWSILNKQLNKHSRDGNWGLYRSTRLQMAEVLRKEEKLKEALLTYLEVCYLDLNGPENRGSLTDNELKTEFPPFDPSNGNATLASGIIGRVVCIVKKLNLDNEEVKNMFFKHNSKVEKSLKLPLEVEKCWKKLEKYLK